MIKPAFEILNQRGTPMFFSDVFANRPNAGIVGRIFISTDTFAFYRDNGVTWDLIGGPGTGTITGSGTAFKYPVFTNTQEIGDGTIEQLSTKNQSTKDFEIKTSTDDGIYESKLFLTNRFGGNDDTITFQYGKTILAGSPFLKISDNNATFPTSYLYYQGGQYLVNDALLVVQNTLQNNVADFYAVEPSVSITATGVSNGAKLTFAASSGTYAGIIKLGNTGNIFQIRTFADVVAFQVNDNTSIQIPNLGGSGSRMVVVDNTGLLSQQAIPTIFGSLGTGQVAFGSASNTIAGSNNLFYNSSTIRLGIGTNLPSKTLDVVGDIIINSTNGTQPFRTLDSTTAYKQFTIDYSAGVSFTTEVNFGLFGRLSYDGNDATYLFNNRSTNLVLAKFRWQINSVTYMTLNGSGRLIIGNAADTTELLQVNGTAKVTGASSFGGNMALSSNQNAETSISVSNTTAGTLSISRVNLTSDSASGTGRFFKYSSLNIGYKIISASDFGIFNSSTAGDISILNDFATGSIKFAAGGSSTAQWTIGSNGDLTAADGENIIVGTTTGTKIGTATSQKIGLWNATPIVQPTTAVASATFNSPGGGSAIKTDDTFDGYTLQQVVKALRDIGILA